MPTIRSMLSAAPFVWRVASTRCPVSAAERARETLSRSRSSPHHYHIGVLAQGPAQGAAEGVGVLAHLALDDHAPFILMQELDRVLQGYDAAASRLVEVIDHRRQGGGFPASRGPSHKHQTLKLTDQVEADWGKAQCLGVWYITRENANREADAAPLVRRVDPESGQSWTAVGKVQLFVLPELIDLLTAGDG